MFAAITLSLAILLTLAECGINIELNNGGHVTVVQDEVIESSEVRYTRACGLANRVPVPTRYNLEQGYKRFRSSLNSSAMYNIKWSSRMADYAQENTDQCQLGFSFPKSCSASFYTSVGSYMHNTDFEISWLLSLMYMQKEYYDSNNNRCYTHGACKCFLLLSRDTLAEFGCASTICPVLKKSDGGLLYNMLRIVCYMSNGSRLHHVPSDSKVPYSSTGRICSKCKDLLYGRSTCINGLCEF